MTELQSYKLKYFLANVVIAIGLLMMTFSAAMIFSDKKEYILAFLGIPVFAFQAIWLIDNIQKWNQVRKEIRNAMIKKTAREWIREIPGE